MKGKLARIHKPWRRLLIAVFISLMLNHEHGMRKHIRAHWAGWQARKPRRLAFYLFTAAILAGHVIVSKPLYWMIAWGAALSFFVIIRSFLFLVQADRDWR